MWSCRTGNPLPISYVCPPKVDTLPCSSRALSVQSRSFDGTSPYKFSSIPKEWSPDGWVRMVDGAAIANAMHKGGKGGAADTAARGDGGTGGMSRASSLDILGERALGMDQSVLPNILTKEEASLLLAYAMPRAYRATHAHHQRGRRRASLACR